MHEASVGAPSHDAAALAPAYDVVVSTQTKLDVQSSPPHPHSQSRFQVRFDWGSAGAAVVAQDADVIVWVDILETDAGDPPVGGSSVLLIRAGIADAGTVAAVVLDEQVRLGRRAWVAVIAAGADRSGGTRFCVEDLLGAGAVIDALAAVGIDYSSPEAATACAAFVGLRPAVKHLVTASASAQELRGAGVAPADLRAAVTNQH